MLPGHTWGGRVLAAALLCASIVLGGCGSDTAAPSPQTSGSATSGSATSAPAPQAEAKVKPTEVRVPKIGAQSSLISVAVRKDGTMQVPSADKPMQAAWYRLGPVPGEPGPAIILGHVDGNAQPGIFHRLHEVAAGDEVFVRKSDGTELKFVVHRREQVPKEQFPHEAVYGDSEGPELRLITCGGAFDQAAHSYTDNVVVYAKLAA